MPLALARLWGLPSSVQPVRGRTDPDSATATTTTASTAAADGKHNGKAPRHLFQTAFAPKAKYQFLNGQGAQGLHDTQHNDAQHNDIQHKDIQHNDIQHIDIQHNDNKYNDIQYNNIHH